MAIISVFSVDTTGIAELRDVTNAYYEALKVEDKKASDKIQKNLERKIASSVGATLIQGKYGKKQVSDFLLDERSSLIKAFRSKELARFTELKAAAGPSSGSKIGQLTVGSLKELAIQGEQETFSSQSVLEKVFGKELKSLENTKYLTELDPELRDKTSGDITDRVFNFYFKKDERLKRLFYAKASTMLLNNTYTLKGKTGTRIVGLQIPYSKFNSNLFKATLDKKAIVLSINDKFQKQLFAAINKSYIKQLESETSKPIRRKVQGRTKGFMIDILDVYEGTQFLGAEVTNSIKVRPTDTMFVRVPTQDISEEDKKQFLPLPVIDISERVQGRTRLRMRRKTNAAKARGLNPFPPKIYERSGTFRESIRAYADFRNNTVQYFYKNYYDSLEKYGYQIEDLVEGSIRSVTQQVFNRQFNLVRTNT